MILVTRGDGSIRLAVPTLRTTEPARRSARRTSAPPEYDRSRREPAVEFSRPSGRNRALRRSLRTRITTQVRGAQRRGRAAARRGARRAHRRRHRPARRRPHRVSLPAGAEPRQPAREVAGLDRERAQPLRARPATQHPRAGRPRASTAIPGSATGWRDLVSDDPGQQRRVREIGDAIDDYAAFWAAPLIELARRRPRRRRRSGRDQRRPLAAGRRSARDFEQSVRARAGRRSASARLRAEPLSALAIGFGHRRSRPRRRRRARLHVLPATFGRASRAHASPTRRAARRRRPVDARADAIARTSSATSRAASTRWPTRSSAAARSSSAPTPSSRAPTPSSSSSRPSPRTTCRRR